MHLENDSITRVVRLFNSNSIAKQLNISMHKALFAVIWGLNNSIAYRKSDSAII